MAELDKIIADLDQLFIERDRRFPLRDQKEDRRLAELQAEFIAAVNRLADSRISCEQAGITHENILSGDDAVFLCGYMKSGTTLLLELLDGHPQLTALPGDSWFMGRMKHCSGEYDPRFNRSHYDNWLTRLINPTGQAPFWLFGKDPQSYVRFTNLCLAFDEHFRTLSASFLLAMVNAHQQANPHGSAGAKLWVEKTPGNEFEVDDIIQYFPGVRFVHIVRDPRENLASLKKLYETRNWEWDPIGTASKLGESCRLAFENQKRFGKERYLVLRYEELTQYLRETTETVTSFLGIDWDDCLLTPTVNTMTAQSNTMYSDRHVKGEVRPAGAGKWRTVLTPSEQRMALQTGSKAGLVGYGYRSGTVSSLLYWLDRIRQRLQR